MEKCQYVWVHWLRVPIKPLVKYRYVESYPVRIMAALLGSWDIYIGKVFRAPPKLHASLIAGLKQHGGPLQSTRTTVLHIQLFSHYNFQSTKFPYGRNAISLHCDERLSAGASVFPSFRVLPLASIGTAVNMEPIWEARFLHLQPELGYASSSHSSQANQLAVKVLDRRHFNVWRELEIGHSSLNNCDWSNCVLGRKVFICFRRWLFNDGCEGL